MIFKLFKPFQSSQRASILFTGALIALMMGCVGISYVQFMQRVIPGWTGGYLPWLCVLISLEVTYTHFLNQSKSFGEQLRSHLAEWVVLFFLIKILTMILGGSSNFLREVSLWEKDLLYFFSPGFVVVLFPSVIIWIISFAFANDLSNIQIDETELYLDNPAMLEKNRVNYRERLGEWIILLGIVVIMLAFFARVDLIQVFGESPASRAPVYNVVVYFLLGFLLLSQAQLSSLQRNWLWDRVPTAERLGGRWLQYSLLFFFLLALLAVLLPTRYTVGLLDTLRIVLNFIVQVLTLLFMVLSYPFVALMNLIFGSSAQDTPQSQPPLNLPKFDQARVAGQPMPWLDILRSLLFWLVFAAIIIYFFRYYLRQNKQLLATLRNIKAFNWLGQVWGSLWGWLRGVNVQVGSALKAGRERLFPPRHGSLVEALRRSINFHSLTPRQRVIFFYLRMVERGSEQGIPRAPSQTPYQYSRAVARNPARCRA